jgi:hypothetical protein
MKTEIFWNYENFIKFLKVFNFIKFLKVFQFYKNFNTNFWKFLKFRNFLKILKFWKFWTLKINYNFEIFCKNFEIWWNFTKF